MKPKPQPKLTREQQMDANAARDMAQMDAANSKPIDPALLVAEPWQSKGGAAAFSWNGVDVVVRRRVVRRRKRRK
jgi:4-aminobutyrate aminotransferase-like enzyme